MIEIHWLLERTQNIEKPSKGWIENGNENENVYFFNRKLIRYTTYITSVLFVTVYALIAIFMHFEIF
jgi:hypothetical protein